MMNAGFTHADKLDSDYAWPTDILAIERGLPCAPTKKYGYSPCFRIAEGGEDEKDYYIPAEVCDTIGRSWFYKDDDPPRSGQDLLRRYLVVTSRGANFLFDVPPDKHGQIQSRDVEALVRLRKNLEKLGLT